RPSIWRRSPESRHRACPGVAGPARTLYSRLPARCERSCKPAGAAAAPCFSDNGSPTRRGSPRFPLLIWNSSMTTEAVSPRSPAQRAPRRPLGATSRRDRWWLTPALTVAALTLFGIYSIVVAAINTDYEITKDGARLLSPFYSPDL